MDVPLGRFSMVVSTVCEYFLVWVRKCISSKEPAFLRLKFVFSSFSVCSVFMIGFDFVSVSLFCSDNTSSICGLSSRFVFSLFVFLILLWESCVSSCVACRMVCFVSCALLMLDVGFRVIDGDFSFELDALVLVVFCSSNLVSASSFTFNLGVLLLVSLCPDTFLVVGKFTFSVDVLLLVVFRVDTVGDFNKDIVFILPAVFFSETLVVVVN